MPEQQLDKLKNWLCIYVIAVSKQAKSSPNHV